MLGVGLAFQLTGCFWFNENSHVVIVGKYYTETTSDTQTVLYFDDSRDSSTAPLIGNVSAIGLTPAYLAVRDEADYYLFIRNAATESLARKTAVGPVNSRTFRLKLKQLSGDSSLVLSSKF